MISKIRAGILSCVGLMMVNILRGVLLIPGIELDHVMLNVLIIQIGYLWFSISLWLVVKYDFIKLNGLMEFRKPLDSLIKSIAIVSGVAIVLIFFPNGELYLIIFFARLILIINYIIVFLKIYKLDKNDLEFVGALHNYIISIIVVLVAYVVLQVLNEFKWRIDMGFVFNILSAFPIIFMIRFLQKEKKDIESKQRAYSINS